MRVSLGSSLSMQAQQHIYLCVVERMVWMCKLSYLVRALP